MKKHIAMLSTCAGVLLLFMLLFAFSALAEDPLQVQMELSPDTLTSPGTIRVSINIINMSDDGVPVTVTLYDPNDSVCSSFGSGGSAVLAPGASQSYQGSWSVTQAQLDAGKVIYSARYTLQNASGQPVSATRPISKAIKQNKAAPNLNVVRDFSPGTNVVENQTVTITFTLKNTGTLDITDIVITDPGILEGQVTYPLLKVGETTELSYNVTMGSSSKTSDPKIAYKYVNGGVTQSADGSPGAKVINVTVPDVTVTLSAQPMVVQPGEKVDFTYKIVNKSNLSYEQLKITDATLGDIDSGISISSGRTFEDTKTRTINQSGTYMFTVQGVDSSGTAVSFQSNSITVQTANDPNMNAAVDAIPVDLEVILTSDREVLYTEPSEVVFNVKVTNFGTTDVKNVVVSAAGKTIRTIDLIEQGQTYEFTKAFTASMGGQFQFIATVKDNTGADSKHESNIIQLAYSPPAPTPTPSPAPTQPPVATDPPSEPPTDGIVTPFDQDNQRTGAGTVLLYVLAALLVIILLAVVILFVLDRRRNSVPSSKASGSGSGQIVIIDSIQRQPHRDYARAPKRAQPKKQEARRKPDAARRPATAQPSSYAPDDLADVSDDSYAEDYPMPPADVESVQVLEETPYEDDIFRRPKPAKVESSMEEESLQSVEDDTGAHSSDYLSRIRNPVPASKKHSAQATDEKTIVMEPVSTMSDEDAALLSGSTGQYRLSRRTATVRPAGQAMPAAEDPVSFSRKQRSARSADAKQADYDEESTQKSRHRRR